ncbi:MAG: DinB family protein [Phycisphaerales bacterium]
MSESVLERPRPEMGELKALELDALLRRAAVGVEHFDQRLFSLEDEQLDAAFLPDAGVGRWPVRVLLGHLADAELVFVHRFRRIVAEERPLLGLWDENAFVDSGVYEGKQRRPGAPLPNVGGFVATIYTLRAWTCEWLAGLEAQQFARKAMHPERGTVSLREFVELNTWHLEHHAWFLNAKVERFLGPAPVVGIGACGAGCGCHGEGAAVEGHEHEGEHAGHSHHAESEGCGKPGCCKG